MKLGFEFYYFSINFMCIIIDFMEFVVFICIYGFGVIYFGVWENFWF